VGATLTATPGTWAGSPAPTYTYQWKLDGVAISGATASAYVVASGDAGHVITVTVTATNASGSASATSAGVNASVPVVTSTILVRLAGAWVEKPVRARVAGAWFG
jgi:hypothetical protein